MMAQFKKYLPWLLIIATYLVLWNHNWYTDDQETLVRSFFIDELYQTQLSVHFPFVALINSLINYVIGYTWVGNRLVAMAVNLTVVLLAIDIFKRLSESQNIPKLFESSWVNTVLFFAPFLCFITNSNGFTNITAIWAMLGIMLMVWCLDFTSQQIRIRFPVLFGIFMAMAVFSRVMNLIQAGFICMYLLFIFRTINFKVFLKVVFGFLLLSLPQLFWLWQKQSLYDFFFWALTHNQQVKKSILLNGYYGDLSEPQVATFWLLFCFSLFGLWKNHKLNRFSGFFVVCFLGGVVSANPSGLSASLQHALPAIPFIALLLALSMREKKENDKKLIYIRGFVLVSVLYSMIKTVDFIRRSNVSIIKAQTLSDGQIIKEKTKPSDRIVLLGVNPIIFLYAERSSGSFASILFPDLRTYESLLLEDLARENVKCVYIEDEGYWYKTNREVFKQTYAYATSHFQKINERIYCR